MPKGSLTSYKRDRKLNYETRRVVKSVLESVLDEVCDVSYKPSTSVPEELEFREDPATWRLTDIEREFLHARRAKKSDVQRMEPFFSIEGSFRSTSEKDQEKLHDKWSILLEDAGLDPGLLELVTPEETQRRMEQGSACSEEKNIFQMADRRMSLPDHTEFANNTRRMSLQPGFPPTNAELDSRRRTLPGLANLRQPTDHYEEVPRKRTMPPKSFMQHRYRVWMRPQQIHPYGMEIRPSPVHLPLPVVPIASPYHQQPQYVYAMPMYINPSTSYCPVHMCSTPTNMM